MRSVARAIVEIGQATYGAFQIESMKFALKVYVKYLNIAIPFGGMYSFANSTESLVL